MPKAYLLDQAKEGIAGGNKAATAILVGLVVWWWAAINPFPFSGLDAPLEKIDLIRKDQAFLLDACRRRDDGVASAAALLANDCIDGNKSAVAGPRYSELIEKVTPSNQLPDRCNPEKIIERINAKQTACSQAESTLKATLKEVRDSSELEILSIKFKRIHPTLHPLIYFLLLLGGAFWLGGRRRMVFGLLAEYVEDLSPKPEAEPGNSEPPIVFAVPWWLWPLPRQLRDQVSVARAKDLTSARSRALLIAAFILAGGIGAFVVQKTLSAPSVFYFEDRTLVAGRELSLTGSYLADLSMLGVLFFVAMSLYVGFLPNERLTYDKPSTLGRRDLLRGASFVGLGILIGAVAPPLIADRRTTIGTIKTGLNAQVQIQPRSKHRAKVIIAPDVGWYASSKPVRKAVAHYANPPLQFVRHNVWPPKRKPRPKRKEARARLGFIRQWLRRRRPAEQTITRPQGVIRGTGGLTKAAIAPIRFENVAKSDVSLNSNYYSNGIENTALVNWKSGDPEQAIAVLTRGLLVQVNKRVGRRLNIRLYDLKAGLLVRLGQTDALAQLATQLAAFKVDDSRGRPRFRSKRAAIENDRIDQRLERWRQQDSPWSKRWRAAKVSWNGIEL